jgi:hypothetical protein
MKKQPCDFISVIITLILLTTFVKYLSKLSWAWPLDQKSTKLAKFCNKLGFLTIMEVWKAVDHFGFLSESEHSKCGVIGFRIFPVHINSQGYSGSCPES